VIAIHLKQVKVYNNGANLLSLDEYLFGASPASGGTAENGMRNNKGLLRSQ
jgi:hypothetical protein